MNITNILTTTLNCLYPTFCMICQVLIQQDHVLCERCQVYVQAPPLYRLRIGNKRSVVVHAAGAYQPPLDGLVRAKGQGMRSAAVPLGRLVAAYLQRLPYKYDIIIPVPLHWTRYAKRGYNQADVMAKVISAACDIVRARPFTRAEYTRTQQGLSKQERTTNVVDAFDLFPGWRRLMVCQLLAGKRVLLIDDVFTTGATIAALASLAWQFRPACVHAAVACRVL